MIKTLSTQAPFIEIDLRGPDGNPQALLTYAEKIGTMIGLRREEIEDVLREMTSGSYAHLIRTFETNFGDFVILYRAGFENGC